MNRSVRLLPADGVDRVGDDLVARTTQPWLRIDHGEVNFRGHWIRLRYRSSFFDDPVRPLLRFHRANEQTSFQALNGPVLGAAEAIVRVPRDTVSMAISPTAQIGRIDFWIDAMDRVSRAWLFSEALRRDPAWAFVAAGARLIQARTEAHQDLKFATAAIPLEQYDAWHRALARPFDPSGIDRPRSDWHSGPHIRLFIATDRDNSANINATLQSLRRQAYPRWTLHVVVGTGSDRNALAQYRAGEQESRRLIEVSPSSSFEDLAASPNDWFAAIEPGDLIPDYGLAAVAEAITADPSLAVVYGDEDAISSLGHLHGPRFKPDWSPTFQRFAAYIGRSAFIKGSQLARAGCSKPAQLVASEGDVLHAATQPDLEPKVAHVRRLIYRRRRDQDAEVSPLRISTSDGRRHSWPTVTVIVPTRNAADHLRKCIAGLQQTTDYPRFDVTIADNGSTSPDSLTLLSEVGRDERFTVLSLPGPFNYSRLCNEAAGEARADVLVFLNNDVSMIDPGWLKALVPWASRDGVGAVGAKLLYPNGSIQHAGVILGLGGRAGHLYRGAPADCSGYLHCLECAHEVTAVTGACLAIARSKFEAIGGFDAANLPVDLNDVDLCLRLAERGWPAIWTPQAVLYHVEGGTRRQPLRPARTYERERRFFVRRWAHVIRNDPYFHPALSLYSEVPALAQT